MTNSTALESAKSRLIDACNVHTGGMHGVWTVQEYINHWESQEDLTEADLIERFNREASSRYHPLMDEIMAIIANY